MLIDISRSNNQWGIAVHAPVIINREGFVIWPGQCETQWELHQLDMSLSVEVNTRGQEDGMMILNEMKQKQEVKDYAPNSDLLTLCH